MTLTCSPFTFSQHETRRGLALGFSGKKLKLRIRVRIAHDMACHFAASGPARESATYTKRQTTTDFDEFRVNDLRRQIDEIGR